MKTFLRTSIFMVSLVLTFATNRLSAQSITYGRSYDMTDGVVLADNEVISQEFYAEAVTFSSDGYKLFILGAYEDVIHSYTLTTPFNLSGGISYDGSPLSITADESTPTGMAFSSDGLKLFVIGSDGDDVNQYSLSAAYDITSTVTHQGTYSVATQTTGPSDIIFNGDGSKMYISGSGIYQYSLSTPFDVTNGFNVSYDGFYSSAEETTSVKSMALSTNGNKMFIVGWGNDEVYQYSLSTSGVITSGVTYDGISYSVNKQQSFPNGITFSADGTRFFIVGSAAQIIFQYNIVDGGFKEDDANDGGIEGSIHFTLSGETFTNAGATMTPSVDYTIDNLPAGLTPTLSISGDGLSGNLLLSGKAVNHQPANDIASLQFTFANSAFTGTSAGSVTNAVAASSGFGIQFNENYPQLYYGDFFDLSTGATFGGSSPTLSIQEATPGGLAFSTDGLKMFIVGSGSDKVHQYSLALPFKVSSGVTYDGTPLSISAQDDGASGIGFSKDGLKLFITGTGNKSIYQYTLNSSFDVTGGGTYAGAFSLAVYETAPLGLAFSTNGKKLFIIGSGGDEVNQFTLDTPYDITKAVSPDGLFSISSQETNANGLAFSYDGKKMFVLGATGIDVNQYSLTVPFDVTTGVTFDGSPFSVSGQESQPRDLAFSPDGSTLFVVGSHGDDVNSYQLPAYDFTEVAANDGTVDGSIKISLFDDKFTNTGGNLTSGTHYTIANLPSGLSSSMAVAADGLSATLTLSGTVANHQNSDDLGSLTFTFENGAFVSGNASLVVGAVAGKSNLGIDFEDNVEITFGNEFSLIEGAVFENDLTLFAASTDEVPYGMTFSADGNKLFVVGLTDREINQLHVSEPFRPDLGYSLGVSPFSVSSEDTSPRDVAFSNDGLKMFVLGATNRRIYEYGLTTPFSLSSGVSYSGSFFSVSGLDTSPTSMVFSADGSKIFLSGFTNKRVYQINLTTPFSIATASSSGNFFTFSTQETNPLGVRFNSDGTRMFVFGSSSDAVHQYSLENPFDLSSGVSYSNVSYNVSAQSGTANGFTVTDDGKRFLISAYQKLYVYSLAKDGFKELPENDGNISGRLVVNLRNDTFVNAGGVLTTGTHYSLAAVPAGLTPLMTVAGDGYSATLTFTGTAASHQDVDDIDELEITFTDAAFTSSDAADVLNAIDGATGFGIDFKDNNPTLRYGSRLDLTADSPKLSSTYDVTGETSSSLGMSFSNNGMRLFIADYTDGAIYQYNLTTPFDISSGVTYSGHSFDVSNEEPQPADIDFDASGTKMYVSGGSDDLVQYSLSTPFDLSGSVTPDGIFDLGNDVSPSGVTFSSDGYKLYMIGSQSDKIFQYSLATPFDVTADVIFDGTPYSTTNYNYTDIDISENGLQIFLTNSSYPGSTQTRQFDLTVPFDITSGVTAGNSFSFFNFDTHAQDIHLSPDGKKMFMLGNAGQVFQFDLPHDGFKEADLNDGSLEGDLLISIQDEQFSSAGGQLTHGSDYTITNLPAGLTPTLTVSGDGYSATLTLAGNAEAHQNTDDIADLTFTFDNSAFEGGNASEVANAMNASSNRVIDFRDNMPIIFYGNVFKVSEAAYAGSPLDVSAQTTYAAGMAFNGDGTKLFVLSASEANSRVYQYSAATPYVLTSGVTYDGVSFDLSNEEEYPEDIAFSPDGTRMYILGTDEYDVFQYNLSNPFDLSAGVTYSGHSFSVASEESSPYGLTISSDGKKIYIAGADNAKINQYSLTTAFELSGGVSHDGSLSTEADQENPLTVSISPDGRHLLVSGESPYTVVRYLLTTPFDITGGALLAGSSFDLSNEVSYPTGQWVRPDGSAFYVVDGNNVEIYQYDIAVGGFEEAAANDGSIEGSVTVYISDDTFSTAGGNLGSGNFSISNLPEGLTPAMAVAGDGYSAVLTLTGQAAVHQDATDIESLIFTFANSAFSNSLAADVDNAVTASSNIGIDFLINTANDILGFSLSQQTGQAVIDDLNHTVTLEVDAGTTLTALSPEITVSDGATVNPVSGAAQNFTGTVNYTVTAENAGQQIWEVTITEQQVNPTDIELSELTIDENNSVGDVLGTFSSVDGNTSQTHLYTFLAGDGDDDNGSFQIDDDDLKASEAFNFETKSEYLIRVQTDDQNGGLFEKAFVITINDINEAPTDIALDNTTVDESNPVGTVVGTLSTTDEDNGQSHTYSLVSGTNDTGNASFSITGSQLKTAAVLDFETQNSYTIRVQTSDGNGGSYQEVFTISVSDLPAQVTSLTLDNQSVMENLEAGAVVGNVTTLGEDLSGSYTYTLVSGTGDTNNSLFDISGSQLVTTAMFDFEAANSYSVRIKTNDGNGNTLEKTFTITVGDEAESSDANILTFVLAEQAGDAVITNADHTVAIDVVFGTDITALTPEITISAEASISPLSGAAQDFTNAVVYTVTAEEGNTQEWTVTVTIAPNPANDILTFTLAEQTGDAVINSENHTVAVGVPYGTNLTALTPTITVSAQATIDPTSGAAADFNSAVVYTVTAGDGSSQEWTVTVTPAFNSATDILTFVLAEQTGVAVIDTENHTVSVTVATGTDATALVPTITVSDQASVSPASGVAQDFSAPVAYTVTAGDGTTQAWTVTVTVAPAPLSSAKDILTFSLAEQTAAATIDAAGHTIAIEVAAETNVTSLVPTITVSAGASVSPASGMAQDFTNAVVYTVTAEDGSTQAWTATVTVQPAPLSSAKDILTFSLAEQTAAATIDAAGHTIAIEVAAGTNVTSLVPTITVSAGASVSPASGAAQDFTNAVVYTVTAEDGTTQPWTATVTVQEGTTTTGVAEMLASISVYPNPTVDYMQVNGLTRGANVQLIGLDGMLLTQPTEATTETILVDMKQLQSGVYILRVSTEGAAKSFRIIKN